MSVIKPSRSLYIAILRLSDILIPAVLLYLLALCFARPWGGVDAVLGIVSGLLFSVLSHLFGAYENWRGRSIIESLQIVFKAWIATLAVLVVFFFLLKVSDLFSRVLIMTWSFTGLFVFMFERYFLRVLLKHLYSRGINIRRVAIVGSGRSAGYLSGVFREHPQLGYQLVGYYDDGDGVDAVKGMEAERLGGLAELKTNSLAHNIHELFITLPLADKDPIMQSLEELTNTTIVVKYVPDLFVTDFLHSRWCTIKGMPVISIFDSPMSSNSTRALKRMEDIIISTFILLFIWPVMLLIALGVKLSSPGPVFYRQTRIGWNGHPFTMLKFRSMPVDLESSGVEWGKSSEKKKTKFGQFIRSTSLDELPQFINVFLGDMSIVGPRPERDIFIEKISSEVPKYMQRHMVKAGITGLAQVNGWRGDTCLKKRVEMDLQYITNWSIWLDLKIIIQSTFKGWVHKNAY
jgi:putative colanic acid biosynthesis UDP-glucose lipid carrier transferase